MCGETELSYDLPLRVNRFEQQVHTAYTDADGLPSANVLQIFHGQDGTVFARTSQGFARFANSRWVPLEEGSVSEIGAEHFLAGEFWHDSLPEKVSNREMIRAVSERDGEVAVAAENGLFIGDGTSWNLVLPQEGHIRWAPVDVRAVAYDSEGRLWFACPQGVGFRIDDGKWRLFSGADGLPYNDFTCMAAGPKGIWFGTTNGAIRHYDHWRSEVSENLLGTCAGSRLWHEWHDPTEIVVWAELAWPPA